MKAKDSGNDKVFLKQEKYSSEKGKKYSKNPILEEDKNQFIVEDLENNHHQRRSIPYPSIEQNTSGHKMIENSSDKTKYQANKLDNKRALALKNLENLSIENQDTFHWHAYTGNIKRIEELISIQPENQDSHQKVSDENSFLNITKTPSIKLHKFQKDDQGLTPLIYAIWGEEVREDYEKKTSRSIINFCFGLKKDENYIDKIKTTAKSKKIKSSKKSKKNNEFDWSLIKDELDDAFCHDLLGFNFDFDEKINSEEFKIWLETIISNSWVKATSLMIRKNIRILYTRFKFDHPKCKYSRALSIIAFAIRIESIECADVIFDHLINGKIAFDQLIEKDYINAEKKKKTKEINKSHPNIIEKEISDYLTLNSEFIKMLIEKLVIEQEKSQKVNIDLIPSAEFCYLDDKKDIKDEIYIRFENMSYAKDFMQCKIINSKIKLPSESGTKRSIEFIQRLATSKNLLLFRTNLIQLYLRCKWNKLWLLILLESLLMWINVILVILLNFVYKSDYFIMSMFVVINFILLLWKLIQLFSSFFLQYLDYVNRKYDYLGIRLIVVPFVFLPNWHIYLCLLYLFVSIPFISEIVVKQILYTLICFGIFISAIFMVFWFEWEYSSFYMIGFGLMILFVFFILVIKFKLYRKMINFYLRILTLSLLIVVVFMTEKNMGIIVLTLMMTLTVFFTHLTFVMLKFHPNWKAEICNKNYKKKIMFFIDLLVVIIFSINFYTTKLSDFYIASLLSLFLAILNIMILLYSLMYRASKLNINASNIQNNTSKSKKREVVLKLCGYEIESKKFEFKEKNKIAFKIVSTFSIALLIGLNLNDNFSIKIFILLIESCFLFAFSRIKRISIKKILKNAIVLIFSWTAFDLARIFLAWVWIYNKYSSIDGPTNNYTFQLLVLLRGLTSFRSFKMTRYYVRLVLNCLKEVLPFMLIFFYSTLSFGIICSIYRDTELEDIWVYPYDLNIGAASHDVVNNNYFSFFIATVINVIIMLNLLISILGDSYDRFQLKSNEIDYIEMAQTLLEIECLLRFKRNNRKRAFLIGIIGKDEAKNRKGKVTMSEFNELKDEYNSLKELLRNKIVQLEKNLDSVKIEIEGGNIGKKLSF